MKFQVPCSVIISGPSQSGKTNFVYRLVKSSLFSPAVKKIIIFYAEWQPLYDTIQNEIDGVEFYSGYNESVVDQLSGQEPTLIIIDDLMDIIPKTPAITQLFTKTAHHRQLCVVLIVHNLFEKYLRTLSLNAQYLVIYKSVRGQQPVEYLGKQLGCSQFLSEIYRDATAKPYSYLVVDLHPLTPDELRFRTNLFGENGDSNQLAYIKRKS
jgi:nucleoside-triphosphatase THEP1